MVGLYYITLLSLLNFSNLEEGNLDLIVHHTHWCVGGSRYPPPFELGYRLVKTCFNRIYPISSLSFFFLQYFVFYALKYTTASFDFFFKLFWNPIFFLWKCLDPPLHWCIIFFNKISIYLMQLMWCWDFKKSV
jgi:hypothetical protein